jgi:MYXO-CTERM domain-containing protein
LDYTAASGGNLNGGGISQRISLGASNPAGFDATVYQARVVGATGGLANGWFNLSVPRSPGWHLAEILLGSDQGTATSVSFFIDNLTTPALTVPISSSGGVNVIELNAAFGTTSANYDDISFSAVPVPEPSGLGLAAVGVLVAWRRRK